MLYFLLFVTLFGIYRIIIADYGVPRTLDADIRESIKFRPVWKVILLNPFQLIFLILVGFLNGALVLRTKFWSKEFFLGQDHISAQIFVMSNLDVLDYTHVMKLAEIHEFDESVMDEIEELLSNKKEIN